MIEMFKINISNFFISSSANTKNEPRKITKPYPYTTVLNVTRIQDAKTSTTYCFQDFLNSGFWKTEIF